MPLSDHQRRDLAAVLDQIVPPSRDGRRPGAGALGLGETIVSEAPDLEGLLASGLDALAEATGGPRFASVPEAERRAALEAYAETDPAFVPSLLFHTYTRYYALPVVLEAIGLPPRPPAPEGYDLEQGDLSLLDPVRARGSLVRDAP